MRPGGHDPLLRRRSRRGLERRLACVTQRAAAVDRDGLRTDRHERRKRSVRSAERLPQTAQDRIADVARFVEHRARRAGVHLAGKLVERCSRLRGRRAAGDRVERRPAAEAVQACAGRDLVARLPRARKTHIVAREGHEHVVRVIGQRRREEREARSGERRKPAGHPAGRGQDRVRRVDSEAVHRCDLHGTAAQIGRAARGDLIAASRRVEIDRIERAWREGQIAGDIEGGDRAVARRHRAASGNRGRTDRADAGERAAAVDRRQGGRGDRAINDKRSGIDRRRAGKAVDARQRQHAGADLDQTAAAADDAAAARDNVVGDDAGDFGAQVV